MIWKKISRHCGNAKVKEFLIKDFIEMGKHRVEDEVTKHWAKGFNTGEKALAWKSLRTQTIDLLRCL